MFFEKVCGTQDAMEHLARRDSSLRQAERDLEASMIRTTGARRTAIPLVPVVFHILWNTDAQNLSLDQLYSQIDVLNADFRALNVDKNVTPAVWQGIIGDPMIQFSYAGVDRRQTDQTTFHITNECKYTSQGGIDAWDTTKYLNIWTVPTLEDATIGGYAQLPYGPAATDGVVMDNRMLGTNGSARYPFKLGRTVTHEVGHWFNLRHIWGDDNGGCGGSDFVDDTPNQASDNHGLPVFPHITCGNSPDGDMFYNYMDYTWDEVQVMFTQGQCDRMDLALKNGRPALMNTLATGIAPKLYTPPVITPITVTIESLGRAPLSMESLGRIPLQPPREFDR